MASSAFKSTTKRTSIGGTSKAEDSGSSNRAHRRSRSLSRFSRLLPDSASDFGGASAPRGRFVNTTRGSECPDISLDDLAIEFFLKNSASETDSERGRPSRRYSEASPASTATVSSQRRGRSVSRQSSKGGDGKSTSFNASGGGRTTSDANSRRKRSVSVVRSHISEFENDIDHSEYSSNHVKNGANRQIPSLQKPTMPSQRRFVRSVSQKDLSKLHDDYSSQSSALTDDEARDDHSCKNVVEKTIRAVYAQKKPQHPAGGDVNSGLYEVMRKELRYAVDEIRTELEQAIARKTSACASGNSVDMDKPDVVEAFSTIRKNYSTKLEQSQKRKQDLLAEILLEEQHGRELTKIVRELPPDPKSSTMVEKPLRTRKRSKDRTRTSTRLTEEAEKYFEDFISHVEDTDLSSFDGERSDTSSTVGVTKTRDAIFHCAETETFRSPAGSNFLPVEMDDVILPWLQWETSNDGSPTSSQGKRVIPLTPKSISSDAAQEKISALDPSCDSATSRGSCSPGLDGPSLNTSEGHGSILSVVGSHQRPKFDMDKYLKLQKEEDLLFERWRETNRINSGCLLLCSSNAFI